MLDRRPSSARASAPAWRCRSSASARPRPPPRSASTSSCAATAPARPGASPNGFRLRGGRYDDLDGGVRLFSRFALPASGTVRFELTRETIPPVVTSEGVWFNVGIVWGRDPAALPPGTSTRDIDTAGDVDRLADHDGQRGGGRLGLEPPPGRHLPDRDRLAPRDAKALANFQRGVANTVVLTWKGRPRLARGADAGRQGEAELERRRPEGAGPRRPADVLRQPRRRLPGQERPPAPTDWWRGRPAAGRRYGRPPSARNGPPLVGTARRLSVATFSAG